jgi:hypothetical protein
MIQHILINPNKFFLFYKIIYIVYNYLLKSRSIELSIFFFFKKIYFIIYGKKI